VPGTAARCQAPVDSRCRSGLLPAIVGAMTCRSHETKVMAPAYPAEPGRRAH